MKRYSLVLLSFSVFAHAQVSTTLELQSAWQSRNDIGIPSAGGTRFSLKEAAPGPFFAGRVYAVYSFNDRHAVRLLIAPLGVTADQTFAQNVNFAGSVFLAGQPVTATYQFNSYRLTYRYTLFHSDEWDIFVGFTGKIRDAKILLKQNGVVAESSNVGFVPLLHFAATYHLDKNWALKFDLDGLVAPQGRAFDGTLQAAWSPTPRLELSAGYRTVEGGAENDTVFTFAWLHYLVLASTLHF